MSQRADEQTEQSGYKKSGRTAMKGEAGAESEAAFGDKAAGRTG